MRKLRDPALGTRGGDACNQTRFRTGSVKSEAEHRQRHLRRGPLDSMSTATSPPPTEMSPCGFGPDRILITPTSVSKGMMAPEDMVVIDFEGKRVSGLRKPSSELAMHLLIYRLRPDVNAVCHAHPPTATGYAAAGIPLDKPILCELVMGLGSVPVARYGTPGTSGVDAIQSSPTSATTTQS